MEKPDKLPSYYGHEWNQKIRDPDKPNFWKYGVADLVFLDYTKDRKAILDVGCGTGGLTLFLAEHGNTQLLVGVDAVKSMIQVAKVNAVKNGMSHKTCFVICDGKHLPFKSSCFNAIVSRGDAFCFLIPMKHAVREFKRILAPNAVVVIEMDNRKNWKPDSIISTRFQKTADGKIAYLIEKLDSKRNRTITSYILNPKSKIAKHISADSEFIEKGNKPQKYPLDTIIKETIETRIGVPTHWPTVKELRDLFKRGGYAYIEMKGDGLLMKLLQDGEKTIVDAMKRQPNLFFKIEHELMNFVDPSKAPTIILKAVKRNRNRSTMSKKAIFS